MSKRKTRRDGRRETVWREAVREQAGSGLSIRGFCRRRRLSEASFYSWRRELRRRDEEETEVESTPNERPPRFVPVSLRQVAGWAVEMVLPSGCVVRMPADGDHAEVAAALIVQVERQLC